MMISQCLYAEIHDEGDFYSLHGFGDAALTMVYSDKTKICTISRLEYLSGLFHNWGFSTSDSLANTLQQRPWFRLVTWHPESRVFSISALYVTQGGVAE